jgi:hypothetical protein
MTRVKPFGRRSHDIASCQFRKQCRLIEMAAIQTDEARALASCSAIDDHHVAARRRRCGAYALAPGLRARGGSSRHGAAPVSGVALRTPTAPIDKHTERWRTHRTAAGEQRHEEHRNADERLCHEQHEHDALKPSPGDQPVVPPPGAGGGARQPWSATFPCPHGASDRLA